MPCGLFELLKTEQPLPIIFAELFRSIVLLEFVSSPTTQIGGPDVSFAVALAPTAVVMTPIALAT